MRPAPGEPEPALLMGVGRQESMFNPWVSSHAGARGLLQLIPRTAFLMARQLGLPYSPGRLIGDPDYNVRLGSHYLKTLLKHYDGEVALAVAAIRRATARLEWIRLHGDPRWRDRSALIDWIELIPFDDPQLRSGCSRAATCTSAGRHTIRPRSVPAGQRAVRAAAVADAEPLDSPAIMIAELVARAPRPRLKLGAGWSEQCCQPNTKTQSQNAPVQCQFLAPSPLPSRCRPPPNPRVMTAVRWTASGRVFDAYGTLFDCRRAPGPRVAQADALSQLWRAKQLSTICQAR
jgi:hypothetical protein